MTVNVICFIIGVFLGALFTYFHALDREQGFRAENEALIGQNGLLRDALFEEKTMGEAEGDTQEKGPGDDAIGVEKDPFGGIEK